MATTAVGPPSGRREDGRLGREQLAERTVRRGPSGSEVREGLPLWSDFPGRTPKRTQKPEGPASTTSSSYLRACAPAGPHSLPAGEHHRHVFKGLKSASAPGRRRLRGQLRRAVRPRGGSAPAPTVMGGLWWRQTPQPDAQAVGACRNLFDAVGPVTGRAVPTCVSTSCPVAHGRTRLLLTSRRPGRTRWRWAARRLARLCGLQHADPDRLPARIAHGKRLRFDFDGDRSCAPRMH